MAELAAEAGVTRTTVYNHATTPFELARDLIEGQLSDQRVAFEKSFDNGSRREAYAAGLRILAKHLVANEALYRTELDGALGRPLIELLTGFASAATRSLIEDHPDVLPDSASPTMVPVLAAAVAHGAVGAMNAWLQMSERDEDQLVEHLLMTVPSWLLDDRRKAADSGVPKSKPRNAFRPRLSVSSA